MGVPPLSDDDVERIATRTAGKLVEGALKIAVVLLLGFWLVPTVVFFSLTGVTQATVGLPPLARTLLVASVLAVPLALLILAWSRSRPR